MKRDGGEEARENGETYFPTYEELAAELLEGLEKCSLVVHDVGHEIEPSSGERTFHATVRLSASEPPHRYAGRASHLRGHLWASQRLRALPRRGRGLQPPAQLPTPLRRTGG